MAEVVAVHQLLPSLHVADASGSHTLRARDALRAAGFESELFVEHVDPPLAGEAYPARDLDRYVRPGRTVLLYQLAVGSALVEQILPRKEPVLVNYHNLTPASFFWQWAPEWLDAVQLGRRQLVRLAPRVSHAIAVSQFNERDLIDTGYSSTSVVPPFVDDRAFAGTPDPDAMARRRAEKEASGGARWLFVGKLLPHKAAHDLLKALAMYRRVYDPLAHLVLVGGQPVPAYLAALREFVHALGLDGAVEFAGGVSSGELAACYETADVFVCLSDHEGFCFPLIEAMRCELPVVAYDAGAVSDTLGTAGILIPDKSPAQVAAAVNRVCTDVTLRQSLILAGRQRLDAFDQQRTAVQFVQQIRQVLDGLDLSTDYGAGHR